MTAIDAGIWTPDLERRRRARICPRCKKRKLGPFESLRARIFGMPVNACCCGTSPPPPCSVCATLPSTILLTATGISLCPTACIQNGSTQNYTWSGTAPNGTFCLKPLSACACMYMAIAPTVTETFWTHAAVGAGDCGSCTGTAATATANAWFAEFDMSFTGDTVVSFTYGRIDFPPCGADPLHLYTPAAFRNLVISACDSFTVSATGPDYWTDNGLTHCDWTAGGLYSCPQTFGGSSIPAMYGGSITATANGC